MDQLSHLAFQLFCLDGVVVVNELVDLVKRSKKGCFMFKIDFEMAYDYTWQWGGAGTSIVSSIPDLDSPTCLHTCT